MRSIADKRVKQYAKKMGVVRKMQKSRNVRGNYDASFLPPPSALRKIMKASERKRPKN